MASYADTLFSKVATAIDPATPSTPAPAASTPPPAAAPTPPTSTSTPPSSPSSAPAAATPPPAEVTKSPAPEVNLEDFQFPDEQGEQPPAQAAPPTAPAAATPTPDGRTFATNWEDAAEWLDKMPAEVREKFMQDPRGRQIYAGYKFQRELAKPAMEDGTGGLGYVPTIEQIREMQQDSSDMQFMVHNFDQAHQNPQYAADFVTNWFGRRGENGQLLPGAIHVAQSLPLVLDKIDPALYRAVAMPIMNSYLEERYRQLPTLPTEDDRVRFLNATLDLESDLSGQTPQQIADRRGITEPVWKQGQAPQPRQPGTDPREMALQQRENALRASQQQYIEAQNQQFFDSLNTSIHGLFTADVQAALKPLADAYPGQNGQQSRTYLAIANDFSNEVRATLGDPDKSPAFRLYVMARDRAAATRDPRDVRQAAVEYTKVARPLIRQLRADYIQNAGIQLVSQSNARHQVLAEAANKTGSASVAQPVAPTAQNGRTPQVIPQAGESYQEALLRTVSQRLTA
jgi:hypothetical protein